MTGQQVPRFVVDEFSSPLEGTLKKSLFILLFLVVAFAVTLMNCGSDTHPAAISSQFAFIQPSTTGSVAGMSAAERHFRMEHPGAWLAIRNKHSGKGLKPWTNTIQNGGDNIVLMNNDGSGQAVVANQAGWFDAVQEGYDGKRGIVSAQDSSGNYQLFYVDLKNQKNPVVTQITTVVEDRWSPQISWDGKQVVFVANLNGEGGRAYLMSASGGTETEIPTTFWVSTPSFTPNGKILFEQEDNDSIAIMNTDGSGFTQLTNPDHTYFDEYPGASPDGKTMVFARYPANDSGGEDIWIANIDGTNQKQLTTDGTSWDPMFVNNKIVFLSARDNVGGLEVYSMNVDGSNQMRLTNDTVSEYFDGW